jgi:hypothetical protein
MVSKEKARQSCGPIPEHVLEDTSEYATSKLHLQVFRLTRCCAISAAMAETLAPLVFMGAWQ